MKHFILATLFLTLISCASNNKNKDSAAEKKASIFYGQGTRQLVNKNYSSALKYLLKANALLPDDSRIQNNLGMAYHFKKRDAIAIKYLKKSLEADAKNTDARLNLATLYMHLREYKEAEYQYKLILDDLTYEGQHRTYYNLGVLYESTNRNNQAISYFKQSINSNQTYCPAHQKLGKLNFRKGLYSVAYKNFRNAGLGLCYKNPEPFYLQALTLIKMGNISNAQLKLEDIISRFSKTKYNPLARRKLLSLNLNEKNSSAMPIKKAANGQRPNREILSPNF